MGARGPAMCDAGWAMVTRSQVRRAGERLRKHKTVSAADRQIYSDYRDTFAEPLREVAEKIGSFAADAPVQSRLKRFETVVEKLRRSTSDLSRLEDIAGCRVVLPTITEQQQVLDSIRRTWDVVRERDYQATPRDGYRARHIVVRAQGRPVEVQVRTLWEDMWANASEALAKSIDPEIKYGGGPPDVRRALDDASVLCEGLDAAAVRRDPGGRDSPDLGRAMTELLTGVAAAIQLSALESIPSDTLPAEFELAFNDAQRRIVSDAVDAVMRGLAGNEP